jgi:hypothetical protein
MNILRIGFWLLIIGGAVVVGDIAYNYLKNKI